MVTTTTAPIYYYIMKRKLKTVMVDNFININKTNNHLSSQTNSIQFNSLLKITNNNTLVFSITNHMIIYKTTFKSYMQYIIIQLYTSFKKCFFYF
jgi:hypothetical protein